MSATVLISPTPPLYSNKSLAALSDGRLIELYWQLFDTRHLTPAHLRAARDPSLSARHLRNQKNHALRRIRVLADQRGLQLKSGRAFQRLFPPKMIPSPENQIEVGDLVYSRFYRANGAVVSVSYSDKRVGGFVVGWLYMVLFETRTYPDACHKSDLTLVKKKDSSAN